MGYFMEYGQFKRGWLENARTKPVGNQPWRFRAGKIIAPMGLGFFGSGKKMQLHGGFYKWGIPKIDGL